MRESYKERNSAIRDQAHSLRMTNFSKKRVRQAGITRVISFTSGKGGVGKTTTVVNLAVCLARLGRSVLILDADLGLANVDVMMGLRVKHTLHDVVQGRKSLRDVIIDGPEGVSIIPAASGVESICNLTGDERLVLMQSIEDVAINYDYLLIDTRAGISADVLHFNSAASEIVCVITNEPTSLTDAYAMIKILTKNYAERRICILANNIAPGEGTSSEAEAQSAFRRLSGSVTRFLQKEQVELRYLGHVPAEQLVPDSIRQQRPVVQVFPSGAASRAIDGLARKIDQEFSEYRVKGGMQFFFQQLLESQVLSG
ncbi:MAG: MinD/ParA family protein [Deltaproteobacteria bacterium]|nr:MinD/ParA family protein [Deltaproteobacteria bacterium]